MIHRVAVVLLAVCTIVVSPEVASGVDFGIPPGSVAIHSFDSEGHPDNRAGAHPYRLEINFGLTAEGTGTAAKDLIFELSPGLASNSAAVPRCRREVFDELSLENECPANTQVGVMTQALGEENLVLSIINVQPAPTEAITLGVKPLWKIPLTAELRPTDFGLTLPVRNLVQLPLGGGSIELWGIPADHQKGTSSPRRAFLTMPTRCDPLKATLRTRSWRVGAPWLSESAESEAPLSGCKNLPFQPELGFALSNPVSDSPTGAQIGLTTVENDDPDGLANSQIKNVNVALPDGLSVSPGGVEGLSACNDDQFALGQATKADCPPSSKVGSVKLESPELGKALTGVLYLGSEHPGDRFRLLMSVNGPGVVIKLGSTLRTDPTTGRLSVVMNNLPQVSIGHLELTFDGGSHALLATPLNCGSLRSTGSFEPYSGNSAVASSASTSIDSRPTGSGCAGPAPFSPTLVAGSSNVAAGRATSFSMTMRRNDGEQLPSRLSVTLPPGLSAAVGSIERCPNSSASSGACPANSRIGSAGVEVGSGSSPAVLHGDVYLTEPYRHSPFGLALVFAARVGPFDLGKFVVRGKLRIDSHTGQVTIDTDSLPQVIEGLPVRFRTLGIDMDRPGFLHNPTSCKPASVNAEIQASGGASVTTTVPFSLNGCNKLGFKPRLSLAMAGRSELHKRGKPGLSISAGLPRGNTNLRMLKLSLPGILKFSPSALKEICSHGDAVSGSCTEGSRVGSVSARSPLFSRPLKGGVFVAQPEDDGLPDLWLSLSAMGVHVDLKGESSETRGHFGLKLAGLPDMPLSTLEMRFPGGESGAFSLSRGLCAHGHARRLLSPVETSGQDGAYRVMRVPVDAKTHCSNTQ